MARETVRSEPLVSCSLKERGLSTARVASLYVPSWCCSDRIIFMYLLHSFFFFFLFFFGIGTNYMLAMVMYVKQWLLINCHLNVCLPIPFSYVSVYNCHM